MLAELPPHAREPEALEGAIFRDPSPLVADRDRPLEVRRSLGVALQLVAHLREVAERVRDRRMIGRQRALADRQRAREDLLRVFAPAL
ncbi:MAG TPA: hypothetical protein VG755_01570 [Nannocystaceae bacterium]|nr:hypothetical protein [Nannocystaceae bacterium]